MAGPTGRERSYDILIDGLPYRVVRRTGSQIDFDDGIPVWNEDSLPATAGKDVEFFQRPRVWSTWHYGAGFNDVAAEGTYSYATGVDCRFLRQATAGPLDTILTDDADPDITAQVTKFFEQSSGLYVLRGQYCNKINTSTDHILVVNDAANGKDFGAGATATDAVNFDGNTVVGFSSSTAIWKFTGSTWAQSAATVYGKYGARWWSDNAEAYVLAGVSTGNTVSLCPTGSDPLLAASWPATNGVTVGETGSAITGIAGGERTLWIAKTDGLYYIDLTRTPRVLETKLVKSTNGQGVLITAEGVIYYPCDEGFYRYDPASGTVDDVSPARGLPNTMIPGPVTAQAWYRGWLFVTTWNGSTAYVCVGRARENGEPGIGPMIWHGAILQFSAQVTAMWVTGLTAPPRLYFGFSSGTVRYVKLPQYGDNPVLDANMTYDTGGILYLSIDNWGVPSTNWQPMSFEFETKGADANNTITAALLFNNGATSLALGTVNTSPRQVLTVPSTGDNRFTNVQLKLTWTQTSTTVPVILKGITGYAVQRPTLYTMIDAEIYCSDRVASRFGIAQRPSGKTQLANLRTQQTDTFATLTDWWTGSSRTQYVLIAPVRTSMVKQDGNDSADMIAAVKMAVIG